MLVSQHELDFIYMTYYRRGRAVRDYDIRISASLHLILLLVQQSQTGCYVTWNQICVLQHDREDLTVGFASVEIIFDAAYFNVKHILFFSLYSASFQKSLTEKKLLKS